jgi:hypothetical protein
VATLAVVIFYTPSSAQSDIEGLKKDLDALKDTVETLKEGGAGPLDRTTIGGYGELHYNNNENGTDKIDFHRFVIFFGHEFNEWIKFDSELEVEHVLSGAGTDKPGEVELEQAFIDLLLSKPVNVRAGLFLVPVGILNETHEPPTFYGVERPDVEKNIIPTTWWEAGVGIFGDVAPGLKYKLYYMSSPDASRFTASSGIRDGRRKVADAPAEDFALTGRLEYTGVLGLKLSGSFFTGDTAQGNAALGDATVTILEADAQYSIRNFDFRGLYATVDVDDADKIKTVSITSEDVGEKMVGWYVEGAWRFLSRLLPETDQELALFARYSGYNTQDEVPAGSTASGVNDKEVLTLGLDYKPHPMVAIKVDYQNRNNDDPSTEAADQWNVGIGYWF